MQFGFLNLRYISRIESNCPMALVFALKKACRDSGLLRDIKTWEYLGFPHCIVGRRERREKELTCNWIMGVSCRLTLDMAQHWQWKVGLSQSQGFVRWRPSHEGSPANLWLGWNRNQRRKTCPHQTMPADKQNCVLLQVCPILLTVYVNHSTPNVRKKKDHF